MLDLYLIRHGESQANVEIAHRVGGSSPESPLTKRGEKQARRVGHRLVSEGLSFDRVFSSTAVRAVETARLITHELGYAFEDVQQIPTLGEIHMGSWEGQPREKIYQPHILAQIKEDPWGFAPPGGESQRDVEMRMLSWVEETLLPGWQDQDRRVLIVGHGLAIRCLLRGILEFSPAHTYKAILDNTGICQLKYTTRGWQLIRFNDSAHLLTQEKISTLVR
ncbi:MAG: histidine phosphatase family protein [Myxococcales bacterium]|nr:histidine phosphatase family protein [Myxococcales bacterium]MCB9644433.1 histidine phosphatase family protein [Myxococcales bacterium]